MEMVVYPDGSVISPFPLLLLQSKNSLHSPLCVMLLPTYNFSCLMASAHYLLSIFLFTLFHPNLYGFPQILHFSYPEENVCQALSSGIEYLLDKVLLPDWLRDNYPDYRCLTRGFGHKMGSYVTENGDPCGCICEVRAVNIVDTNSAGTNTGSWARIIWIHSQGNEKPLKVLNKD